MHLWRWLLNSDRIQPIEFRLMIDTVARLPIFIKYLSEKGSFNRWSWSRRKIAIKHSMLFWRWQTFEARLTLIQYYILPVFCFRRWLPFTQQNKDGDNWQPVTGTQVLCTSSFARILCPFPWQTLLFCIHMNHSVNETSLVIILLKENDRSWPKSWMV